MAMFQTQNVLYIQVPEDYSDILLLFCRNALLLPIQFVLDHSSLALLC